MNPDSSSARNKRKPPEESPAPPASVTPAAEPEDSSDRFLALARNAEQQASAADRPGSRMPNPDPADELRDADSIASPDDVLPDDPAEDDDEIDLNAVFHVGEPGKDAPTLPPARPPESRQPSRPSAPSTNLPKPPSPTTTDLPEDEPVLAMIDLDDEEPVLAEVERPGRPDKAASTEEPHDEEGVLAEVEQSGIYGMNPELAELERALLDECRSSGHRTAIRSPQPGVSTVLLSVERSGSFARVTAYHFRNAGWRVDVAEGVHQSLRMASPERISLIITDTTIKGYLELCLELKVNKSTNHIPIIAISPPKQNPAHAQELRVLPDELLLEPFELSQLLQRADWELARVSKTGVFFDQRVHLILPTRIDQIDRAKSTVARLLRQSTLDEKDRTPLFAALAEAVGNAARHGNRNRPACNLEILYILDFEKMTLAIKDEGEGFDISPYCTPDGIVKRVELIRERLTNEKIGTLGIPLLASSADRVQYHPRGNLVTLTKYIHPR